MFSIKPRIAIRFFQDPNNRRVSRPLDLSEIKIFGEELNYSPKVCGYDELPCDCGCEKRRICIFYNFAMYHVEVCKRWINNYITTPNIHGPHGTNINVALNVLGFGNMHGFRYDKRGYNWPHDRANANALIRLAVLSGVQFQCSITWNLFQTITVANIIDFVGHRFIPSDTYRTLFAGQCKEGRLLYSQSSYNLNRIATILFEQTIKRKRPFNFSWNKEIKEKTELMIHLLKNLEPDTCED